MHKLTCDRTAIVRSAGQTRDRKTLAAPALQAEVCSPFTSRVRATLELLKRLPTYIGTVWTARHSHGNLCCYDLHAASHQATNAALCLCTPLLSSTASDMRTLQVNATVSQHSYCAIPCTCPVASTLQLFTQGPVCNKWGSPRRCGPAAASPCCSILS